MRLSYKYRGKSREVKRSVRPDLGLASLPYSSQFRLYLESCSSVNSGHLRSFPVSEKWDDHQDFESNPS